MSSHFERARLLFDQDRYELAMAELHRELAIEPDNASCHAMLALCWAGLENYPAALAAIDQAIGLSPNFSGFHYIKAGILRDQEQLPAARTAIAEAIRLDPEDADCYARLAAIQYDQDQIEPALVTAEQGLQLDAEHIGCMNIRVLALMSLDRLAQAEADVQAVLAAAPDNAFAHTVQGWIALHRHHIPTALESFREALRLQPDFDWARKGLVEALKSRNGFYRAVLSFDRWRSQLNFGSRAALLVIPQIRAIFLLLIFISGLSKPIFTFLLSLDPYGKLTLTPTEIKQNRWIMGGSAAVILWLLLCVLTRQGAWLLLLLGILLVGYCVRQVFYQPTDWLTKGTYGLLLAVAIVVLLFAGAAFMPAQSDGLIVAAGLLMGLILMGLVLFVVGSLVYQIIVGARRLFTAQRK